MTISGLPSRLISKAIVLAGEYAWSAQDALSVISSLQSFDLAVVGVELWHEENGSPKWIASSDFDCKGAGEWTAYVRCCALAAADFVEKFRHDHKGLFNLVWIKESEYQI